MNKLFNRVLAIVVLCTLLISYLPIAGNTSFAATSEKQFKLEKNGVAVEKRKKMLEDVYSMSDNELQDILDQGYTLEEAENALKDQKTTNGALKASLDKVKPRPVNKSKEIKSIINSELGNNDFSSASLFQSLNTTTPPPVPDYSYVNTKGDEAPYSVNLGQETVSTLSGSLSLQAADLSLPGRNGLSFTLARSYDSGSSQFGQMVTYNGTTNGILPANDEMLFPIGKGWSWNLSYIEYSGNNKFLHLGGSGTYKIDSNNALVGYPWKDLTFTTGTTVVNGQTAAFVLTSIQKISQHFNVNGQLLQISDAYNNTINFGYTVVQPYGSVLTSITDAIGNTINITYTDTSVVLTKGIQTVTYLKTMRQGKELLTQVIDPIGRTTTYDYDIKDAKFNALGTTPETSNPYVLLTGVTHPTGAKSIYTYEDTAITRYIGTNSVNQVYRVKARKDQITLSDNSFEISNLKDISYPLSDIGSSYNTNFTFSVTVDDGLTKSTFNNKKNYIDEDTPPVFYNTSIVSSATYGGNTYTNTADYIYDEVKKWPAPITTTETRAVSGNPNTFVSVSSKAYDDYGNVTTDTDPMGVATTYTYDVNSHLLIGVSQSVSSGQTRYTEYVRDQVHKNVTTVRVRDGSVTGSILQEVINSSFDSYGNVTQTKILKGTGNYTLVNTEYNPSAPYLGAFPTKQTVNVHDADNTATNIIKQFDYMTTNGALTNYIDGNNNTTTYQYDLLGRATKAVHPDDSFIAIHYLDYTNEIRQTDETGSQSFTKWNPLGWKTESGINEGGIYKTKGKYGYDAHGRMTWSEDAIGNRMSYGYDQWSRQNLVTYPDAATASLQYDDIANTKTSTDAEGYILKQFFDKMGRLLTQEETKKIGSGATTQTNLLAAFTYNHTGQVITAKDSLTPQNTTTYGYDVLGQLTSVNNAKNELTSYQYDILGNLTQVTYPDTNVTSKKYDEIGRLIQTTNSDSQIEKFYYDDNGNQTRLLDRKGNRFKYTFNNRNFQMKKEIVDASWNPIAGEETISYNYDLAGRRTQMVDVTGTTAYDFSPATGALSKVTFPDLKTIKYDYDAAGNRFVMNDPFGRNTYYHYDSRNRLDTVAASIDFTDDYEAKYQYFKNDLLKQTKQRNGVTSDFIYDGHSLGSLTQKKSDGSQLNAFTYTYDKNGNQKTKIENGVSNSFDYDQLNRILNSTEFNETYGYDNRGNRTSMTTTNPFDRPDAATTYDKRDRLTQVALTSGGSVTYKYNGDGLLWERTENGQTTRYYWDGDQIIAEAQVTAGSAALKARYIRGQGLIAREDGQGKAFYLQNGHGDVIELRDSTGNTRLNQYTYDIFGNISSQTENIPQPFKYSGEMMDGSTDLQYLRARWYDPSIGRFINEDTYEGQINNPLSLNLYTYVHNNPLTNIDPTGNWCTSQDLKWSKPGGCNGGINGQEDVNRNVGTSKWTPDSEHNGNGIFHGGVFQKVYYHSIPSESNNSTNNSSSPFVSQDVLVYLTAIHYNRNVLNKAPSTEQEAIGAGWRKLKDSESIYHRIGFGNENNAKYVSPSGNMEGVYDQKGNFVTDPVNMGTYNFKGPDDAGGHTKYDVIPYFILGNSPNDPTTFWDKVWLTIKAAAMKIGGK
ncbi:RHS repeat-associated core domain-containing protein [Paenibacillus eucommiae]|uniref:RHS repeat-associated protein n=1 Tax=Paenibacillus eucommiae TaxID=1355755 RepID=A0ABS4J0Q9_9BACL|nr:RHS repeat-associated core domain-containing protein [Paenibacillus eucommiae]MBP1992920.1 RHS repeat-associated protein [Paenibacillus eucommiae]